MSQKLAIRLLKRLGYQADLAENGLEVLEELERQPHDVAAGMDDDVAKPIRPDELAEALRRAQPLDAAAL